ncbi:unnamed protein product [Leptosia nina]|uniref:Carboxylesterase type B domain-containing protein n=1 Tax=Leptosia nina TaxID=320188 RepID=A0AAV1JD43_9NEOP
MECEATVKQGRIRGKICTTPCGKKYYSFEGIPYAKPPVGPLRFTDPQSNNNWTGTLDATKPGNKCVQMDLVKGTVEGSEDCLYLNIYTPSLPSEKLQKLPVLFFIHGGRLLMGCSDYYRPDYLIPHDVIVVTINYRLNIFGYLCLNTPEAPGNAGLKDVAISLKWVHENIANFNGDTGNIIAFGESAGGAIALSLITSTLTRGMVSKVIAQSGTALSDLYMIDDDPIEKAKEIASNLGHKLTECKDLHDLLSKASAEELLGAYMMSELGRELTVINAFMLPVVERKFERVERFFDEYPLESFRNNRYDKVPIIMSMGTHEAALFLHRDGAGNIVFNTNLRKYIPRFSFLDEESSRAYDIERRLREVYFQKKEIGPSTLTEYICLMSDAYFNRDLIYTAELLGNRQNVYLCRFDYPGNMNTRVMKKLGIKGTTHGDLIQYVFYKEKKAAMCKEKDREIVSMLSEAWCNFAKTGKPTWTNQGVEWSPYRTKDKLCLNIGESNVDCRTLPEFGRNKVWLDIACQRSKL